MLQLGDLIKMDGEYNLYKITVYANSRKDRYYTFCTPECAKAIDSYLDSRSRFGEVLKPSAPLIREQFDVTDSFRIKHPQALSESTFLGHIKQLLKRSGMRSSKVKQSHGFRKFAITQMIKAKVDYDTREYLVGHRHSRGLGVNYDRTTEEDRLEEYLKAINLLTIDPKQRLQTRVEELETGQAQEIATLKARVEQQDVWLGTYNEFKESTVSLVNAIQSVLEENGLWPKDGTKAK